MARCVRGGVSYRRHKVVNRMCARCGAVEVSQEKRQELIDKWVGTMTEVTRLAMPEVERQTREFQAMLQALIEEADSISATSGKSDVKSNG